LNRHFFSFLKKNAGRRKAPRGWPSNCQFTYGSVMVTFWQLSEVLLSVSVLKAFAQANK
jgi:hypothetical protein